MQTLSTRCPHPTPASARYCRRPVRVVAQAAPRDVSAQAAAAPAAVAPPHAVGTNNAVAGPHLSTTDVGNSTNIRWHDSMVARTDKEMLLGQRGCVLWFTGGWQLPPLPSATVCPLSGAMQRVGLPQLLP